ncbi:polyprenyl synthetase family protein [Streptomyces sp. NBC_01092]|uniref:polyprenyl synthetase family protein n=1 Tax=Streptomyces sp. NBC_01092 TaxID=2903748 RepID=UPI00386D7A5F
MLADFLDRRAEEAAQCGHPVEATEVLRGLLCAGVKRIRPALCALGWACAGRASVPAPVVRVDAALETFHTFALIHDDVMDGSSARRGRPTAHRVLAARHAGHTDADRLGTSSAVLVGDVALVWSEQLVRAAGLTASQLAGVFPVLDVMRTELMYGQYLDLLATGEPTEDVAHALAIARFKTAKYSVERPLHLGAALAEAGLELPAALSSFALPAGEAFQLRDDLLGVFGDPVLTGKSAAEDLRDAKHTVLVALALRADSGRYGIRSLLCSRERGTGRIAALRSALEACGARAAVEDMIADRCRQALDALEHPLIDPAAAATLRVLTRSLWSRTA